MGLYNPSIEQGLRQTFENNFYMLSQQTDSRLANSPAVNYITADGNKHNISRVDKTELIEANTRNPKKQYIDLSIDNRALVVKRYTRTFLIDKKDAREMVADPKSSIYAQLMAACARTQDRVIAAAASADVEVGSSDSAKTTRTAAQDGVITIDATSGGLVYTVTTEVMENFINNDVIYNLMDSNITLAIAGQEHTDLVSEDKFINNDFTEFRPVDKGTLKRANGMTVIAFAGSKTGGITVDNPILKEDSGVRTNIAFAPKSIALAMRLKEFDYQEKEAGYVNSSSITVVFEIEAIRYEGEKVQLITTTI
jgi:hypothetical protein